MKKEIVHVNYGDIKNKDTKLTKVLNEHQVEFQLDPKTGQYVAYLDLKKHKVKPPPRKRDYTLTKHRVKQQDYHPDCRSNSLKRRAFKGASKSRSVKKFEKPQVKTLARPASMTTMKTYNIINEKKQSILKEFQPLFPDLDFYNIKTAPILIGISFLSRKIEFFYNKQFEAILRTKSSAALNLSRVIYGYYLPKYKESKLYLTQKIADLVYTIYKYKQTDEIRVFYEFLTQERDADSYLFYLYIRQHFKFITFTYFLNHKSTEKDPREITITREKAFEIIDSALYFSDPAAAEVKAQLAHKMQNRKLLSYYGFMLGCIEANLAYDGMDLMSRCLSLYNFRNNPDVYNVEKEPIVDPQLTHHYHKAEVKKLLLDSQLHRAKQISRMARTDGKHLGYDDIVREIEQLEGYYEEDMPTGIYDDLKHSYGDRLIDAGNFEHDYGMVRGNIAPSIELYSVERPQEKIDYKINKNYIDHNEKISIQQKALPQNNPSSKTILSNVSGEDLMVKKFDSTSKVNVDSLQQALRLALRSHIEIYISEFCGRHDIKDNDLEVLQQTCQEMFYAKALKILTMVFENNKQKFFELIRADISGDNQAFLFWRDLWDLYYDYRVKEDPVNFHDVDIFINRLLHFQYIKRELDFLLTFQFNVEDKEEVQKKPDNNIKPSYYKGWDAYRDSFGGFNINLNGKSYTQQNGDDNSLDNSDQKGLDEKTQPVKTPLDNMNIKL